MNITTWKPAALLISFCFLFASIGVFSQETESIEEAAPPMRNIFADSGYAVLGIITSNTSLNLAARLAEQSYAQMTFAKIWENLYSNGWIWEDGDRFLINQFGHPYQGSTYFASARANGFSFYESILFVPMGSLMWELLFEPQPATNDFVTTTAGGIALGEMLHRLFLEVDSSPSIGARIGGFFVSPISGFNKIYNRPARMTGGGNIYSLSVNSGIEKTFAFFPRHEKQADSWKYPGAHFNMNVIYGDPFNQQSKTPYEHFELYAGFTTNTTSYNAAIVSDGYLFSFDPVQTNMAFTSTGLSLHFDFYNATNDLIDNLGYGNIQFSNSAVGWTLKNKYQFSENFWLETKAHAAFTFWGNSMYNGEHIADDYWVSLGNNHSTYGMGENVKLFFTFFHNKAGKLEIAVHSYYISALQVNDNFSKGNVFFLYDSLAYDFPLGKRTGIGVKGTFWGLFGLYDSAENVSRFLASSCLYVRFML
jgi:hypothetical protein